MTSFVFKNISVRLLNQSKVNKSWSNNVHRHLECPTKHFQKQLVGK